jgi:hypothetical protein
MSSSSSDDTDSTESDGEYDSELHPDVPMCKEVDVDSLDGVDLDGDVDMERDGEDEEDEEEEDKKEEDEKEEEVVDEDEDNGKESPTIGQGEMVNTSADDADTMIDDQPTMLPGQGQERCEHTPRRQPLAPAPQPRTLEPHRRPQTPESQTLSRMEILRLLMPQKPRPAAPTLREAEAAGNISDVDVKQQILGEWAGGDSLPDICLPAIPLPDVPLPFLC